MPLTETKIGININSRGSITEQNIQKHSENVRILEHADGGWEGGGGGGGGRGGGGVLGPHIVTVRYPEKGQPWGAL